MHAWTDVRAKQEVKSVFPLGWHNSGLCMSLYGAELHQHEHTGACQHRILHALAHPWVDSCVNEEVYGWDPADTNTVRGEVSSESSTSQAILAAPAGGGTFWMNKQVLGLMLRTASSSSDIRCQQIKTFLSLSGKTDTKKGICRHSPNNLARFLNWHELYADKHDLKFLLSLRSAMLKYLLLFHFLSSSPLKPMQKHLSFWKTLQIPGSQPSGKSSIAPSLVAAPKRMT